MFVSDFRLTGKNGSERYCMAYCVNQSMNKGFIDVEHKVFIAAKFSLNMSGAKILEMAAHAGENKDHVPCFSIISIICQK